MEDEKVKQCCACNQIMKLGKEIVCKDDRQEQLMFCSGCYNKMPKGDKKHMTYVSGGVDVAETFTGFPLFGVFTIYGYAREDEGDNRVIKRSMEKYNYTLKQINDLSIDLFNTHSGMLDEARYQALMDKFEGKTNSKNFHNYIQNQVRP
jgi:hypothetical protein